MNSVNKNLGGPPTQGRKRECERRKRQMAKVQDAETVAALFDVPVEILTDMTTLDDAQLGYLEERIEEACLRADQETQTFAKSVLDALGDD